MPDVGEIIKVMFPVSLYKNVYVLMKKYFLLASLLLLVDVSFSQRKSKADENLSADRSLTIQKNLSDSELLDRVQKQTIKYFWEFAHPVSGMARERSNVAYGYGNEVVTTGGTGFGIMALIAVWSGSGLPRDTAAKRFH